MRFGAILLLFWSLVATFPGSTRFATWQQVAANDEQVNLAIKQLQSADESERWVAKETLLHLGPSVIPPLLVILKEIADNHYNVYYIPDDPEGTKKLVERQRLLAKCAYDVYEVLGKLHAKEAVPLLIKILEERPIDNLFEKMRPEMFALVEIGPAAVPTLIESIENAAVLVKRNEQKFFDVPSIGIQRRAAVVLGEIGDARALPLLEKLLEETNYIEFDRAIEQIKKKNGQVIGKE